MTIERYHSNERMSQIVVHKDIVYLSGQVADKAPGASIVDQTQAICDRIDQLLDEVGTNKSNLLSATIWLSDIRHYDEMNKAWNAWLDMGTSPARACVEAKLAYPEFDVEIMVVVAK